MNRERSLIAILLLLIFLVAVFVDRVGAESSVSVCRDTSVEWLRFRFTSVDWGAESAGIAAYGASPEGETVVIADAFVDGEQAGTATWQYWTPEGEVIVIVGDVDTPPCDAPQEGDAPSIAVEIHSDCAHIEIDNGDGGWSRVEVNGEPVLLHYGESLIAGRNQSLDPEDYRAVEVACYE